MGKGLLNMSVRDRKRFEKCKAGFQKSTRATDLAAIKKALLTSTDSEIQNLAVGLTNGSFKEEVAEAGEGKFHHGVIRYRDLPKRDLGSLLLESLPPTTIAKIDEAGDDELKHVFALIHGIDLSWKMPTKTAETFNSLMKARRQKLGNHGGAANRYTFDKDGKLLWYSRGAYTFEGDGKESHSFSKLCHISGASVDISKLGITSSWPFADMHSGHKATVSCDEGEYAGVSIKLQTKFKGVEGVTNALALVGQPEIMVTGGDADEGAAPQAKKNVVAKASAEGEAASEKNLTKDEALSLISTRRRRQCQKGAAKKK